jgi:ribonuclease G
MAETLLIDAVPGETRAALIEDGRAVEIVYLREGQESRVGQVFLGRVQRILPGVRAAFIDLGLDRAGFLSIEDAGEPLHEGKAVMLQISKDAIGRKGVQLTRRIALPGRTLVLTPLHPEIQVSRRIGNEAEQARLKRLLGAIAGPGEGFILRTAAAGASDEELATDAEQLRATWDAMEFAARERHAPALLYGGPEPLRRVLIELAGRETTRIVIDDAASFAAAKRMTARAMKDLADRLELHTGAETLFEAEGIEAEIEQALASRVRLPSGGEIVIEGTEALTAVDVNTGSHVGEARAEDTLVRTNLEAAEEIARQLRLRAIGGMVAVDFAHMAEEGSWNGVLEALGAALARDRSAARVLGRTAGGLVEVTRRRTREPLAQLLTGSWRGGTADRTAETVAFDAMRAIRREAAARPGRVRVTASSALAAALEGPHLAALADSIGREVSVSTEPGWPRGRFEIAVE